MLSKFISRKLLVTLVANVLAVYLLFGGAITPEQTAAIVALVNTAYIVVNGWVTTSAAKNG